MSVVYIKVEVSIHGLAEETAESARDRILEALRVSFVPEYAGDLEVELIESAGTDEGSAA